MARPGVIVAGASFAAIMTGIVANALLMQKGHHPSPLFRPASLEAPATEPSHSAVPVPPPAPRQALDAPQPAAEPATSQPAVVEPVPASQQTQTAEKAPAHQAKKTTIHATPAPHAAAAHKPAAHQDLIGQLLNKQDPKAH